ncbi:penicillin-binding protein activator [Geminicoccaceae bacterium 1502E]|nr:penicillin-binding protein activator [Geminicoccaceae bacterium 1502E]
MSALRSQFRCLVAGGVLALGLAACVPAKQTTPTAPPQPVPPTAEPAPAEPLPTGPLKVGLLLPLSGNTAAIGQDMLDAAQLALFDVGQSDLVLLPQDTGGTPEGARKAARGAIAEGAELLLGPLFGASTKAAGAEGRAANLRVLSFSNDAAVAGNGVYTLGYRPGEQVDRVVGYAVAQGMPRVAVLAPDDAYGGLASRAARQALAAIPGAPPAATTFYGASGDVSGQVGQVMGARPQAILIADGGARLRQVLAALAFYTEGGERPRLLGTRMWEGDPELYREPLAQDAWLATVDPDMKRQFAARFAQVYGREPHDLATLAYDATALAALLGRTDRSFADAALTDPEGFAGSVGIFRLRTDGTSEHGLAIATVEPGGLRTLDPAPSRFAAGIALR